MKTLINALEDAVTSKRIPIQVLTPTASVRSVCDRLGMNASTSVRQLVVVLGLTGNFMPGQQLGTGRERKFADWNQADLLAVGLDSSVWKFWTANENPWTSGVVKPTGAIAAGAPLAVQSMDDRMGDEHDMLGVYAASTVGTQINVLKQDPDGNWTVGLAGTRQNSLPKRANLAPYFGEAGAFVAVDLTGTLQLYRMVSFFGNAGLAWSATPISKQSFAPPGAPVAIDTRIAAADNQGGPTNVFVVDNHGAMWVFETEDDGVTWSGSKMPSPKNISYPPGAHIATGFQAGTRHHVFGQTDELGYCQLDVFAIDRNGVMHMWWESQGSGWTEQGMSSFGSFPPGAPIATGMQAFEIDTVPVGAQLDVFAVDTGGTLRRAWNYKSGSWSFDALPGGTPFPPGAFLATNYQSIDENGAPHQLDVFAVGLDGRIAVYWQNESPWNCETMPGSDAPVPGTFM